MTTAALVAVLVLASASLATPFNDSTNASPPYLSATSGSESSSCWESDFEEAHVPILHALLTANTFIRNGFGDITDDGLNKSFHNQYQILETLHVMSLFVGADLDSFHQQEVCETIFHLVMNGDHALPLEDQIETLLLIGKFLDRVEAVDDPDLSSETFTFVPFLLRHFSDSAFRICKRDHKRQFILPLLGVYAHCVNADYIVDCNEWERFLEADNSLHSRLYAVHTFMATEFVLNTMLQMFGMSSESYTLSLPADLFCRLMPESARQQIWLELYYYETKCASGEKDLHNSVEDDIRWIQIRDKIESFHPLGDDSLLSQIYHSPHLHEFLNWLRLAPLQSESGATLHDY